MPCMFIPKYHVTSSVNIFKIPLSQDFIWPCSFNPISFYLKIPKFSKYLSLRIWFGHARLILSLFISKFSKYLSQDLIRPCSFNPISFYLKLSKFSKYLSLKIWFGQACFILSLFTSRCQNFQNTSLSRFDSAMLV